MRNWTFVLFFLTSVSLSLPGCMTTTHPQNVGDVNASKGAKSVSSQQTSWQVSAPASEPPASIAKKAAPAQSRAVTKEYSQDVPSTQWFINDSKIQDYA